MVRRIVLLMTFLLGIGVSNPTLAGAAAQVTLLMKASPDAQFHSEFMVSDKNFIKQLLHSKKVKTDEQVELPLASMLIGNEKEPYIVSYSLNLYATNKHEKWVLPGDVKNKLKGYLDVLKQHHFGESLSWNEAKQIFPRMGYAEVFDLESGLSFSVQRRAGSRHADVQPLTAEDSHIMKKIYGGKWSWTRRAILVKTGGKTIAASMNGMPHGAGAIANNDFPGHFCIHFKDSTTHKRNVPDPGHDYMVLKATGKLLDHLVTEDPVELSAFFVSALHEKDLGNIPLFLNQGEPEEQAILLKHLNEVEGIKLDSVDSKENHNKLLEEVKAVIRLKKEGEKERKIPFVFYFTRSSVIDRWKLQIGPINKQLHLEKNDE